MKGASKAALLEDASSTKTKKDKQKKRKDVWKRVLKRWIRNSKQFARLSAKRCLLNQDALNCLAVFLDLSLSGKPQ